MSSKTIPKGLTTVKCNRRQCKVEHDTKEKFSQLRPKRYECFTTSEMYRSGKLFTCGSHLLQAVPAGWQSGTSFRPFITWSSRFTYKGWNPASFLVKSECERERIAGDICTYRLFYVVQNATLSRFPFYLCHLGLDPSCWRSMAARWCGTMGGQAITSHTIVQ